MNNLVLGAFTYCWWELSSKQIRVYSVDYTVTVYVVFSRHGLIFWLEYWDSFTNIFFSIKWKKIAKKQLAWFAKSETWLHYDHGLRSPNEAFFLLKSRTFGLGQTNWANKFLGIWGIFGQTISTHFGTVSPLSMVSIIQPLFLQKTKPWWISSTPFRIPFRLPVQF